MISYVRGTLVEKEPMRAVVEAAGIGYELLIPLSTYDRLPPRGEEAKLLAAHVVREDDESLFGFATPGEREMFTLLTGVSGVGPRMALAILSGGSIGELALAIASGESKRLSSIKGVGKKTAEKICIELKDRVNPVAALASAPAGGRTDETPMLRDAILALTSLGFTDELANRMVSTALARKPSFPSTEALVREALSGGAKPR